ncbi:MAG: DUF2164 domain-containing protein [Desulfosporosinus sp.]
MNHKIELSKEKRQDMILAIQTYFLKERKEELGNLASSFLLDFITDKLGIEFYNQGVYDSCKFMKDKTEDLLELVKY